MKEKRVLIIDDDRLICDSLKRFLALENYQSIFSLDGNEGIRKARDYRPDLIILDIMMPIIDGIEVCRLLRQEPQTETTPIIVLTAKYQDDTIAEAIEGGADSYLTKPVKAEVLSEAIRHAFALERKGLLPCQLKAKLKQQQEELRRRAKREPD